MSGNEGDRLREIVNGLYFPLSRPQVLADEELAAADQSVAGEDGHELGTSAALMPEVDLAKSGGMEMGRPPGVPRIMVRNGSCYRCLNCGSTSGFRSYIARPLFVFLTQLDREKVGGLEKGNGVTTCA